MNRLAPDPRAHLALYRALLDGKSHFEEFKRLLSMYWPAPEGERESEAAFAIRCRLNDCISQWLGCEYERLSVAEVVRWRAIVVGERSDATASRWEDIPDVPINSGLFPLARC